PGIVRAAPVALAALSIASAGGGQAMGQRWYGGFAQLYSATAPLVRWRSRVASAASAATRSIAGCDGPLPLRVTRRTRSPSAASSVATPVPIGPAPTTTWRDISDLLLEQWSLLCTTVSSGSTIRQERCSLSIPDTRNMCDTRLYARRFHPCPGTRRDDRGDQGRRAAPPRRRRGQPLAACGRPRARHGVVRAVPLLRQPG